MNLTKDKLSAVLTSGDFEALIGASEAEWFECKGQPYQLANDAAKRELAKDVSSFANASGGFIVIGLQTVSSATHFGDEIKTVSAFAQGLVNITQYEAVLDAWVYPAMSGVTIVWQPTKKDPAKGVIVIKIPPQKVSSKPYLVKKSFDGTKHSETLLGYAERKGGASKPLGIAELHSALRVGLNYETLVNSKFEALEALIKNAAPISAAAPEKKIPDQILTQRLQAASAHGNIANRRHIILSAIPVPPGQLKSIFLSSQDSVRRKLEHPPKLRSNGWDVEPYDQAKILKGEAIRVTNHEERVLDLYRDGMMVAAAPADENFLAWGQAGKEPRLNPVALMEYVYSFVNLYSLVLEDFVQTPNKLVIRIELHHMHLDGIRSVLGPYALNTTSQQYKLNDHFAPEDEGLFEIEIAAAEFEPISFFYDVVKEIYLWFGIEEDKIPYFKIEAGKRVFDAAAIANI